MLRGALRDLAGSGEAAEAALTKAGVDPMARGESLTVEEFARIAEALAVRTGLTVRAAAKINLLLGVGAPRPDGFHTLVTVYQAVSLYDDLTVTAADELHRRRPRWRRTSTRATCPAPATTSSTAPPRRSAGTTAGR